MEPVRLTPNQLEAVRKVLVNILGKTYIIISRVFAHMPITKKPLAVRMGGGAGEPVSWAALVKPGAVLLEIDGSDKNLIIKALNAAAHKLPCKTKIICGLGDEI
jgi:large subunit ribosomal protein L16